MIGVPFDNNDLTCLSAISEVMVELVERRDPLLVELADKYPTTEALAAWIRSLPQRDDFGAPDDGPKVEACEPVQRVRIPAPDPNCVERAALYLGVAELIDPQPVRQLATLDFPHGRHTFPIENGAPVVLDPRFSGEELARGIATSSATAPDPDPGTSKLEVELAPAPVATPGPVAIDVHDAIEYTGQLAEEGTRKLRNGPRLTWLARNAIRSLVDSGVPPTDAKTIDTLGWFFAHAEQVARSYGERALTIVRTTAAAISELIDDILAREQRNLSFEIGGTHYRVPSWLADAAGTIGKVGLDLGVAYARPYLLGAGLTGEMLNLVEEELNAEGYSLGPLSKPGQSISSGLAAIPKKTKP
ncbi:MAG TPA: hypothetical protein VFT22_36360 [Kofleriaceae bacterium]|nr:hypothetical protein [Kofleriaceae bacterium]